MPSTTRGRAVNGDYEIEYEALGDADSRPLLLVNGFTSQMIRWPEGLCRQLTARGFYVVAFDNRDVGLSTKTPQGAPDYTLSDMAADGLAVLDALAIDRAHVVGMSMGGMIAQVMAIEHPGRVASLCSIMSTTGDPSVGGASDEAMTALRTPPPRERAGYIEHAVASARLVSGTRFDEAAARDLAAASYDRCFHPEGALRQMAAIVAAPDRTESLRRLDVPTLVVHGRLDPLIRLDGGEATAAAVPGSELVVFDEMGHDLPESVWPQLVARLDALAARAGAARTG
jgi:pimeloyl-ACP methyl ester carboxylesterase